MERQKADMDTIAEHAGVSRTTVFRALHNKGRIRPKTRARILQVAQELGYRPNLVARSLRTQRTATIGVITLGLTGWFYSHVLEGIYDVTSSKEHGVIIASSYGHPERERKAIEMLSDKRVDGLIIAPADPVENVMCYRNLLKSRMPVVFIDRYVPELPISFVGTNNEEGGYFATAHLLRLGRRRIAFVSTSSRERRATSVVHRFNGYERALREFGIPQPLVLGPGVPDVEPEERYAFNVMTQFLQQGGKIDAVFAVNDDVALGVMRAVQAQALRIPDDVAVVGFDDQDICEFLSPPLTTVAQPMKAIGEQAAKLLFEQMEQGTPSPIEHVLLRPQLVVRMSCGAES